MKISVLFLTLLRTKLTIVIKLLILVSSFLFLTLVASPSAAAENLDLELRKLSNTIKLLILVSSFLFLTLVASPSAAAENLDLELRKLSNTIKLLILVSCFFFLVSYPRGLVIRRGGEPGSGASETLQYN